MNTNEKIQELKDKVQSLAEDLINEINEISNILPYKEGSVFSYHADRLKQFNDNLQNS